MWFGILRVILTVKPLSLRFSTHTTHSSFPAKAVIKEDFPQPGGP